MKIYTLHKKLELPISQKEAWDFFANAENLAQLTPKEMNFRIESEIPPKSYPGLVLAFSVTPLLGVRQTWVSEITQVQEPDYFIDVQVSGPYKYWHHKHGFNKTPNGVELEDLVHYALPFSPISNIFNGFIRKELEKVFAYRQKILKELFG